MKIFFTAFFLLVQSALAIAQEEGGWTTLSLTSANRIDDIYFHGKDIGWTAGGWNFKVHKTIDGGETWTPLTLTNNQYLRSIKFFDENIGLCGSVASSGLPQAERLGALYRTTDGGTTWTNIAPSISPRPAGICGLAKAGESTMYGVGVWYGPAFVIKSTDKGATWKYIDMSSYANSLIDAYFFNENEGFVTGSAANESHGGIVLYTADGGKTWTQKLRTNQMADRIWKIQTPDKTHFFGSVESFAAETKTRMIRSSDRGQTWEIVTVDDDFTDIQMVGFIDRLHGWTGGAEKLFETNDGGDTWAELDLGSTYYNRFFKTDNGTAYLTGRGVFKFTREIVTNIPEGPTTNNDIHSMDVSPNPASEKVTVTINFGNPTMAQLFLYSATGQSIKTLFSDVTPAGARSFTFDVSGMPAQSLVVALQTNEGILIRKVLVKP
jgi:photosystem II stability/assembly factor-like uncharacterized protein